MTFSPSTTMKPRFFRMKTSRYVLINDVLFKKLAIGLLQRCLEMEEAQQVLQDIHKGDCGNHFGGMNLSVKVLRMGYYWTTLRQDALNYVKKCDACRRHALIIHQLSEYLHPSTPSWPFMKRGMDIVGKMPQAPGQKVFMLAITDYFSKWIEAEAFRQVKSKEVISFIQCNIFCKFGVPSDIIYDNGSQFISDKMEAFSRQWNITLIKSTPRYPQANGQAESSNKIIINNLKKRLTTHKGLWAEQLPWVLWADRTTPKSPTGQTSLSLVYGTETVLPTEITTPTARYSLTTSESNKEQLVHDLDTIDELRDMAKI